MHRQHFTAVALWMLFCLTGLAGEKADDSVKVSGNKQPKPATATKELAPFGFKEWIIGSSVKQYLVGHHTDGKIEKQSKDGNLVQYRAMFFIVDGFTPDTPDTFADLPLLTRSLVYYKGKLIEVSLNIDTKDGRSESDIKKILDALHIKYPEMITVKGPDGRDSHGLPKDIYLLYYKGRSISIHFFGEHDECINVSYCTDEALKIEEYYRKQDDKETSKKAAQDL